MKIAHETKKGFSLRAKLVLSYLGVALGAILLMVLVVSIAVQKYFYQSQIDQIKTSATDTAETIAYYYGQNSASWIGLRIPLSDARSYFLVATADKEIIGPDFPPMSKETVANLISDSDINNALLSGLQGSGKEGEYQLNEENNEHDPLALGIYASAPIQFNGKIIGAVVLIQPNHSQNPNNFTVSGGGYKNFNPSDFLSNVNTVVLIGGAGIAIIVIIFSLFMTRQMTRPLISLTMAAEGMKSGNYEHRVEQPKRLDELGQLATTFNAMADKIAADVNALRIQKQLRRDLIANIAHDLVTPLTAIQGYSEAIADDIISDPGQRQETALLIGREVQRLRRLVSDMQNMTALEAGRVQLDLAPLSMHDLVEETLAVIAPECEQAEIKLQNDIHPLTPPVLADSDRITQVLLNLLDNARRHTPSGGQILVGARVDDTSLIVWVKDTGIGINPEDLPYIFERFYRVDRSRNAASGGSGLGLAIIKAIINGHGGTVWAQSTPGQGTAILFRLPLAPGGSTGRLGTRLPGQDETNPTPAGQERR